MPPKPKYPDYSYRPDALRTVPPTTSLFTENPKVDNVPSRFRGIAVRGTQLAVWDGNQIPGSRYAHYSDIVNNHFQGIARLRNARFMAISGGEPGTNVGPARIAACSHLFIAQLPNRSMTAPWMTNLDQDVPFQDDALVKTVALDNDLWHAGGLSCLGDILAVPTEKLKGQTSRIRFLHMKDPMNPGLIGDGLFRPDGKCGAVALARLSDGTFLCGAWSDSDTTWTDDPAKARRLDLYQSVSPDFHQGFNLNPVATIYDGDVQPAPGAGGTFNNYQGIAFISPQEAGKQDHLYLIGMANRSKLAPTVQGEDRADLFELDLRLLGRPGAKPSIQKLGSREFICTEWGSNFNAAVGLHVLESAGELVIYSAYHWRVHGPQSKVPNLIHFAEFRQCDSIGDVRKAWIELYEHQDFNGRQYVCYGKTGARIPDYGQLIVNGAQFDGVVSSIRYQAPMGYRYRLYKDKEFANTTSADYRDLLGDGAVREIRDLNQPPWNFGDQTTSSQCLSDAEVA